MLNIPKWKYNKTKICTGDGTTDATKIQDEPPHRIDGNGDTASSSHVADTTTSSARSKRGADKHYLSGTSIFLKTK